VISASNNRNRVIPLKKKKKVKLKFSIPKMKFKISLPILILIMVFGCFIFSLSAKISDINNMKYSISELEKEVEHLRNKNADLRYSLELIQSDEYVEQVAREQLGLVKSGEKLVVPGKVGE